MPGLFKIFWPTVKQGAQKLQDLFTSFADFTSPLCIFSFAYIVYDDEDCGQGDLAWISSSLTWEPLKIGIGESKSFSLLKDLSHLYKYKNDIESFVVRKGCTLKVSLFLLYLVVKLIYR